MANEGGYKGNTQQSLINSHGRKNSEDQFFDRFHNIKYGDKMVHQKHYSIDCSVTITWYN